MDPAWGRRVFAKRAHQHLHAPLEVLVEIAARLGFSLGHGQRDIAVCLQSARNAHDPIGQADLAAIDPGRPGGVIAADEIHPKTRVWLVSDDAHDASLATC